MCWWRRLRVVVVVGERIVIRRSGIERAKRTIRSRGGDVDGVVDITDRAGG